MKRVLEGELKMRIISALDSATEEDRPTINWIKEQDIILSDYSTQKLSRLISDLVEMDIVKKAKSRVLNRMVYKLTSKMEEEGYEIEEESVEIYPRVAYVGKKIEDY